MHSIQAKSLSKHFGDTKAVDDVSFEVDSGEIFGFLGSNGAGKSTTMMILTTLLRPTSGQALVAGHDVVASPKRVRQSIGYVQQDMAVDDYLTGRENLLLQARLNHIPKNQIDSRIDEVLGLIELGKKQDEAVVTYSGGMRKRLDIAGGLLHRPKVLFLDEPTVGLDIQTRRKIWEYIRRVHDEFEMTIFLTTHYMEEADSLCDRVGIINNGTIRAIDSPHNMKSALGNEMISLSYDANVSAEPFLSELEKLDNKCEVNRSAHSLTMSASRGTDAIPRIFQISSRMGVRISSISITSPTLDDVFISYTGHDIQDSGGGYNREREHARMKVRNT